jgi:hypothetical protein
MIPKYILLDLESENSCFILRSFYFIERLEITSYDVMRQISTDLFVRMSRSLAAADIIEIAYEKQAHIWGGERVVLAMGEGAGCFY